MKNELAKRSANGDADASYRIAEFYIFAGGDGDPNVDDAHDRREKRRWLETASRQGHQVARFNLAVDLAKEDCPRARRMMEDIVQTTPDEDERTSAGYWLRNPAFDC